MSSCSVLVDIALPRVRDFRGVSAEVLSTAVVTTAWVLKNRSFSQKIDYDKIDALRGLDITLTTTAKTDDEGRALLKAFQLPFP